MDNTEKRLENTDGAIKYGQYKEKVREYRWCNQIWTIQRKG